MSSPFSNDWTLVSNSTPGHVLPGHCRGCSDASARRDPQPIGQLLLHLRTNLPGCPDVVFCPGHVLLDSCDVLEAQIETLSHWAHLSLNPRLLQNNLQRFGNGVVLAEQLQSFESGDLCGRFCNSLLRASSNAVFAVDCSCPKACNAASRKATLDCFFFKREVWKEKSAEIKLHAHTLTKSVRTQCEPRHAEEPSALQIFNTGEAVE